MVPSLNEIVAVVVVAVGIAAKVVVARVSFPCLSATSRSNEPEA